jgi:hypothetical protein
MNPFDIENFRQFLLRSLPSIHGKSKVFMFYNFYQSLFDSNDGTLVEAYCLEFIEEYVSSLKSYSAFCLAPGRSERLISQLTTISALNSVQTFKHAIVTETKRIRKEVEELLSVLSGSKKDIGHEKLFFPLIEENGIQTTDNYGFLETVRVTLNKRKDENKLYVFPSVGVLDERIEKQIFDSLSYAIKYLGKYKKKFSEYHDIFIYFENYSANYIGNSLGIALTVGFIEQLTSLYNLPFLINIQNNVASTGSVSVNGKINSINKEFIEKKIEVVFYSPIDNFIVPKGDEIHAVKKLAQLKELYPQRNLQISGVDDLEDIFNRRNLINISKQNILLRSYKTSKKNWQVSALIILLYMITAIVLIRDFDENPGILENAGNNLYIKNKSGRILWTKIVDFDTSLSLSKYDLNRVSKLVDVNNDGFNEIIISNESSGQDKSSASNGKIECYNYRGTLMWVFNFEKMSLSSVGSITPSYISNLVDTISLNDKKKYLIAFAADITTYNSAIFKIDLESGRQSKDILWHKGPIRDCRIIDFNNDGKKEIAFAAFNTSFEKVVLGIIDPNSFFGQCPSSDYFTFKCNVPKELLAYIMLPKTDFTGWLKKTGPPLKIGCFNNPDKKTISLKSAESGNIEAMIDFFIPFNSKNISVSLTKSPGTEKLLPQTIIKNKLKDEILFWNGKEFLNRNNEVWNFR